MKKLWLFLALLLLLGGCKEAPAETEPTEPQLVTIDIYALNDLHGRLTDTDTQPGVDELTTYLKSQPGNKILLSTGDMWQGTAEASLTGGAVITQWMNHLDFAAMTLGGHEYDWGEETIRQNLEQAEFPFLAINVYSRDTDSLVDYCQASVLVEVEGVQIGIIGAIGDCYSGIAAEHTRAVYFKTGSELTALVKAESQKLRSQGADFIVYAIHDGATETTDDRKAQTADQETLAGYYDPELSNGFVDLVFEADTHYRYVLQDTYGVYHLQGGANGSGIAHAKVVIDRGRGISSVMLAELLPSGKYSYLEDDPVVEQLLEQYAEQLAPANRVLGINEQYRTGAMLSQLVADLYCAKGQEAWSEYDIVLGGGYLSCRAPGYLPVGEVTYSQLQSLLPFDNKITLCSIRGRDLVSKFLETDNDAYYIKMSEYGQSIRQQIDPDGTYYLVTDSYTADYAYNNLTTIATYDEGIFARDLVADHIAAGGLS